MTIRYTLICLSLCCAPCAGFAQSWSEPGVAPAFDAVRNTSNAADKSLLRQADQSRSALETSLRGYVVAFDTAIVRARPRVGLPLATFADTGLELAYDVSGQSVMAQWRLSQPRAHGERLDYRAYVGADGSASLVISTRF